MEQIKIALAQIVGEENVSNDSEILESFSKDCSFVSPRTPSFVVKPQNEEEVRLIVNWANETGNSLVPVSSGVPHFYGDTVPSYSDSIIIDLSRMNKIIRIDRRNRVVLIEPGVTYGQLQPELAKEGLRLSTTLLPRRNKSVTTSLLERQPTLIPKYQWTLLDPLRCLQVIWGDGSTLWTGEAGEFGPNNKEMPLEEQWRMDLAQLDPIGPGQIDYYRLVSAAQGTLGIVTKASIRCEILPSLHTCFIIQGHRIENLIECAYKLLRVRIGDEFLILNGTNLTRIVNCKNPQTRTQETEFPAWVIIIGVAGRTYLPKQRIDFQEKDIQDIVQQDGLQLKSTVSGFNNEELLHSILSPSREPFWKFDYKGGCQDIFFLTTLDRVHKFLEIMYSIADDHSYPKSDIGIYIQPQQQGVVCHCEFSLPYDPNNKKEAGIVNELLIKASETFVNQGAFFSRPYGIWANLEFGRSTQNTVALKKVKKVFDPNNVLNPGKLCF